MTTRTTTTRAQAVQRIAGVFRRHGYEGASLKLLSEASGLGKASLYHHFPGGKEDMARAVLEHVSAAVATELVAPLQAPGEPRERLRGFVRGLRGIYADGRENCILGAFVLGGGLEPFQRELAVAFATLIEELAVVIRQAGVPRGEARSRAEDAIVRIQGALVLSRGLGDRAPFERLMRALVGDLLDGYPE